MPCFGLDRLGFIWQILELRSFFRKQTLRIIDWNCKIKTLSTFENQGINADDFARHVKKRTAAAAM